MLSVLPPLVGGCTKVGLNSALLADCTLSSTWKTVQTMGSATAGMWGSGGLAESPGGDIYLALSEYDISTEGPIHLMKFDGSAFQTVASWDRAAGRVAHPYGIQVDSSGTVWIFAAEFLPDYTDGDLVLLKYVPGGSLTEVHRDDVGGQGISAQGMTIRDDQVWILGSVLSPTNSHAVVWRYENGVQTGEWELDSSGGLANSGGWGRQIKVAPNGRIWVSSQYEDAADDEHAEIFEENATSTGFTQILDHQQPGQLGEMINDFAFDSSGGFIGAYSMFVGSDWNWGIARGLASDLTGSLTVTQAPTLFADGTGGEYAFRVIVHSSGRIFMSGAAYKADSTSVAVIHELKGTTLVPSDQYTSADATADFWQTAIHLFEDSQRNLWAVYDSYDQYAAGFLPTYTVIKHLPCR